MQVRNLPGEKSFCKTSFQVRMSQNKVQKQGRDETTQEDYITSEKHTADVG